MAVVTLEPYRADPETAHTSSSGSVNFKNAPYADLRNAQVMDEDPSIHIGSDANESRRFGDHFIDEGRTLKVGGFCGR